MSQTTPPPLPPTSDQPPAVIAVSGRKVKVINHGAAHRIDLGRGPRQNQDEAQGRHRGFVDLLPGENLIEEERWDLASKNPMVQIHLQRVQKDHEGKVLGLEVSGRG